MEKGISVDQPKTLLPLSNHCFSQTSELDKRRCILSEVVPERIQILLWFIKSSLLSKLWVQCFCLVYSHILFLWWTFPDIPNEGDWWVRDRLLPSFSEKGVYFCLLTVCSLLNQSKGLVASIQWKTRLASVFTTLQIFSSKGVWWVRDCSLPSFSDMKASLRLVWLVSFYVYLWWWRCWICACSIFLSEHGSETRHGKRPEPRTTLCLLEYDCGANALG